VRIHATLARHAPEGLPHVVRVLDCLHFNCRFFIVTEALGDTLLAHYSSLNAIGGEALVQHYNAARCQRIGGQMADALAHLAELGISHCDVKPANICIANAAATCYKLIDLGSATFSYDNHVSYVQPRWYRAPEVILGLSWDPKIDVWSLGCVLTELLLGVPLYHYSTAEEVLAAQRATAATTQGTFIPGPVQTSELVNALIHNGYPFVVDPGGFDPGIYQLRPTPSSDLRSLLAARVNADVFGDVMGFADLIEVMLTIDPSARPNATQVRDMFAHEET